MRRTTLAAILLAVATAGPAAAQQDRGDDHVGALAAAHQTDFQIGQLATIRGQSARVRAFGRALVDDHGAAIERLAKSDSVRWPIEIDARHRQLEQELSTLDGRAFDRKFVDAMVEDHQALASMLKNGSESSGMAQAGSGADRTVGTSGTASGSAGTDASADTPRATGTSGKGTGASASPALRAVEKHLAEAKRLQRSLGHR